MDVATGREKIMKVIVSVVSTIICSTIKIIWTLPHTMNTKISTALTLDQGMYGTSSSPYIVGIFYHVLPQSVGHSESEISP